jgi:probable F420-dependent oxidoreductase
MGSMLIGGPMPYAGPLATSANIISAARHVEQLGFDFVEVGEHLIYPRELKARYPYTPDGSLPIDATRNHFEIFTLLSFVAGHTTSLRLHSGVLVLPYRPAIEVAKMAASLDHLSNGRLTLGVGVGWMRDEFEILGVPWERRGAMADESLEVIRALFDGVGRITERFAADDVIFEPRPTQNPLPIWVAGTSDAALRRVARFGNGWFPVTTPEGLPALRDKLTRLLEREGRSIDEVDIVFAVMAPTRDADAVLGQAERWLQAGCTAAHFFSSELYGNSLTAVLEDAEWFAEAVMPELRRMAGELGPN